MESDYSARSGFSHRVRQFFYQEETPYGLAIVRFILPLILLVVVVQRWPYARELFSTDGAPAQLSVGFGHGNMLPEFSGNVAVALFTLLGFFLVTSSIGWCTRFSLFASTVLYTYFNLLDCIGTMTKYSVIASHVLLLLTLSNCGAVWSVDSWLKGHWKRNGWPGDRTIDWPRFPVWPRRLIQLLIGIVYFGAAITKLHTPPFFSGEQLLFWMISDLNFNHRLGEYMTLAPVLLVVSAYATIVWEIVFVFIVWRPGWRLLMLGIGIMFHLMTCLTLGLYIFPLVCTTIYWAFLEEEDIRRIARFFRRCQRRIAWFAASVRWVNRQPTAPEWMTAYRLPSPLFLAASALLVAFVGAEAEYRMDIYGVRRPEGPHELREMDPEYVKMLLTTQEPLREVDKFFSFNTGSMLVGNSLLNHRTEFRVGETIIAQCIMNAPHEDLWVECNLHDADGRIIDRTGTVVTREMLRSNYAYKMPESLTPGEYQLVLRSSGKEVARRKITLKPSKTSPAASEARPVAN